MPAATLGAAFPRNGIEDILTPLEDGRARRRRETACKATQYLLIRTEQDIYHTDPTEKKCCGNYQQ